MNKIIITILASFLILSLDSNCQTNLLDSSAQVHFEDLEKRIPYPWQLITSNDTLKIRYISEFGIYASQCCSPVLQDEGNKNEIKWLREEYLHQLEREFTKLSDTLEIVVTFTPMWSQDQIEIAKTKQDSINNEIHTKHLKRAVCKNYYWNDYQAKQTIPFYSNVLNCAVFFERPISFVGIYELTMNKGIPSLIIIEDKILLVEQLIALELGITEHCFNCGCKE